MIELDSFSIHFLIILLFFAHVKSRTTCIHMSRTVNLQYTSSPIYCNEYRPYQRRKSKATSFPHHESQVWPRPGSRRADQASLYSVPRAE